MNNPTKLLNTDIIAVEVPKDARVFEIIKTELQTILRYFTGNIEWKGISLPKLDLELLGEATEDEISFDVEPYVDFENDFGLKWFRDYTFDSSYSFDRKTANESFRSLLQASGKYWVNPLGKEPSHLNYKHKNQYNELVWISESHKNKYCDIYDEWQEAESKRIKGKLIFLKIIK